MQTIAQWVKLLLLLANDLRVLEERTQQYWFRRLRIVRLLCVIRLSFRRIMEHIHTHLRSVPSAGGDAVYDAVGGF